MSTTPNNIVTDPKVISLLDATAKKQNITNPEYDVKYTMRKGDGFMSIIYDAKIKSNGKEVLSVITKMAPENKAFREQSGIRDLFENEITFYNEIYPAFYQLQIDRRIETPFQFAAKCYYTSLVEEREGLVLENLRNSGYKLWNRQVPMNEAHVQLTIKAYAKFHALSFAFKDQWKQKFDELSSKSKDVFAKFAKDPKHMQAFEKLIESTIPVMDPENDKKYLEQFKAYINTLESQQRLMNSESMDEYAVIGHGDCWCNNMMYKYDDPDDPTRPTGINFVDFQIIRYITPISDFTHYFYTSTTKKQQDNIEHYLDLYYSTLADFVRQLGSDPDKMYPREVFEAHWRKYRINGLNTALFMIRIMTSDSDEVPDFKEVKEDESMLDAMVYEPKNTDYKKRVRDTIVHFCEKGFI